MGQIRITGGTHRSRKIVVDDQPGLRPTADRVRETLFNWLGHNLSGYDILDLYAGSGILSFEAASRNAQSITAVDNNPKVITQLKKNLKSFPIDTIQVVCSDAQKFIKNTSKNYQLVFLDPPFGGNEITAISAIITPLVQSSGLLYREYAAGQEIQDMNPDDWLLLKHKQAGQVRFELWQKN